MGFLGIGVKQLFTIIERSVDRQKYMLRRHGHE